MLLCAAPYIARETLATAADSAAPARYIIKVGSKDTDDFFHACLDTSLNTLFGCKRKKNCLRKPVRLSLHPIEDEISMHAARGLKNKLGSERKAAARKPVQKQEAWIKLQMMEKHIGGALGSKLLDKTGCSRTHFFSWIQVFRHSSARPCLKICVVIINGRYSFCIIHRSARFV